MIRNASLKDNNNLLKFIPKKLEEYSFGEAAEELAIGGETLEAAAMFDKSVSLLFKQADDANDYLRKMVERIAGFADEDEERKFLKNFFVVVPALTTCYIEVVQNAKEKLMKHDDSEAFISDDGFSLGVVYLLKVLGVTDNFNGLNWFDSMETKLATEQEKNEKRRAGATKDKALQKAYGVDETFEEEELSIKRLKNLREEFKMLNYTYTASSILFKEI